MNENNPDNLPVDSQELIDLVQKIHTIGENLSYRELNEAEEGHKQACKKVRELTEPTPTKSSMTMKSSMESPT